VAEVAVQEDRQRQERRLLGVLKLTAKTNFVVAESTGEANFKVILKWTLAED
jgi:hypothetical protein